MKENEDEHNANPFFTIGVLKSILNGHIEIGINRTPGRKVKDASEAIKIFEDARERLRAKGKTIFLGIGP